MRGIATDPAAAGLVQGLQLVVVGYAVYSIFAASVSATHTGGPFFVIAALVGVLYRVLVPQPATSEARVRIGSRALVPVRPAMLLSAPATANPWRRLAVTRRLPGPSGPPARTRRELWAPPSGREAPNTSSALSERHA
jgi:hypothetical protein